MRVAVVLGAAVRADGTPSPALARRVEHAVAMLAAGRVDAICLTGGVGRHGPAEAEAARLHALARGAPAEALVTEDRSTSTVGNLANAFALLPPGASVVLVSNRWHLPRARLAARLMGRPAAGSGPRGALGPVALARAVLREAAGMPATAIRAWRARPMKQEGPLRRPERSTPVSDVAPSDGAQSLTNH